MECLSTVYTVLLKDLVGLGFSWLFSPLSSAFATALCGGFRYESP